MIQVRDEQLDRCVAGCGPDCLCPTPQRALVLTREVRPARSWFIEVVAVWTAVGALVYASYTVLI